MPKARRRTARQRAASRRNLEIARKMKARGTKRKFKKVYQREIKSGLTKAQARNLAWGMVRHK